MIEGINIRCNVGPFEVLRSPRLTLSFRRRAVVSRAEIDLPDPNGSIRAGLAVAQAVRVRFGHRGEGGTWQEWSGTVKEIEQAGPDVVRVTALGLEKALLDTTVTLAMHGESSRAVASRLLSSTGLAVAGLDIPAATLPHIVFSGCTVARAIKQLAVTLERSFGHDLSRHAVWLGAAGLYWSDGAEPGDVYVVQSADNLLTHSPDPAGMSHVWATLLPGLTASRMVRIRDARRGFSALVMAQSVYHELGSGGNKTLIGYGKDEGWG